MPKLKSTFFVYVKIVSVAIVLYEVDGYLLEEVGMKGNSKVVPELMDLVVGLQS